MKSLRRFCQCVLLMSLGFLASGCLGPLYGVYELTKPDPNEEDKAALNDAPVANMGAISRQFDSSAIAVNFNLADPDGGTGNIDLYFKIGTGDWTACTNITGSVTGLNSPVGGAPHSVVWNAVADLGGAGTVPDVKISIIPSDAFEAGFRAESSVFISGNDAPLLVLSAISTPQVGNIIVDYNIQDNAADDVNLTCEYSLTSAVAGFMPFTVAAGETTAVTSSITGKDHSIVWASHAVPYIVGVNRPTVWVRITAADGGGASDQEAVGPFEVQNNGAQPVCSIVPINRSINPQVQVDYSLIDSDSDTGSISIQYSPNGSTGWTDCTEENPITVSQGKTGLSMTPDPGTPHIFVWDSVTDLTAGLHTGYYLRITPNDGNWDGIKAQTGPFDIGNDDATATVTTPTDNPASGNIVIKYKAIDSTSDNCIMRVYHSTNSSGPWVSLATAAVGLNPESNVSSAPSSGIEHSFVWNSVDNYPGAAAVYIRVEADDGGGGTPGGATTGIINVDNTVANSPPAVVIPLVSREFDASVIPITFNLSDADTEMETCDIDVYFMDEGQGWTLCDPTDFVGGLPALQGLDAPNAGQDHTITWNGNGTVPLTGGAATTTLVRFRIIANDGTDPSNPGDSAAFSAGNNAPTVTVTDPAAGQSGNVVIDYNLADPAGDSCDVEVRWRLDSGSWPGNLATSAAVAANPELGVTSSSGGVDHSFVWDTGADLGAVTEAVHVRVAADDGPIIGYGYVSAPFTVNNNRQPSVTFLFSETILDDDYTIIPIPYRIQDPEGDTCTIELEYKLFGDSVWRTCTAFPDLMHEGFTGLSSYVNAGNETDGEHLFLWNSLVDCGRVDQQCELRLRAIDGNANTSADTLKLVVLKNVNKWQPNSPRTITVGSNPRSLAVGDLNGDGHLDIGTGNFESFDFTIIYGDAVGFKNPVPIPGEKWPWGVAMGDINGDGFDDFVGANYLGDNLYICYGSVTGHRPPQILDRVDAVWLRFPGKVLLEDINQDGYEDILCMEGSRDFYWSMGGANGHEDPGRRYVLATLGSQAHHMETGDINGDGFSDIAATTAGDDRIAIMYGSNADPYLSSPVYLPVEAGPQWVTVVDINGDGFDDIVNPNRGQPSITYALGPDPLAGGAVSLASGTDPDCIAGGDINGDGYADFVASGNPLHVYFGTSAAPQPAGTIVKNSGADYVRIGDVNGDGFDDILWSEYNFPEINVHYGHAWGYDALPSVLPTGEWVRAIEIGDIDSDGYNDVVSAEYSSNSVTIYSGGDPIRPVPETIVVAGEPSVVGSGDVNGDGFSDIFCTTWVSNSLVTYNGGPDVFTGPFEYSLLGTGADLDTGDFNGDGRTDVLIGMRGSGNNTFVGYGNPAGHLVPEVFTCPQGGAWAYRLAVADMNQDGFDDYAYATLYQPGVCISLGSSSGAQAASWEVTGSGTRTTYNVAFAKMDGDAYPDLIALNSRDNTATVIYGAPGGYEAGPFQDLALPSFSSPENMAAGDLDGDGYGDVVFGNQYNAFVDIWYGDSNRAGYTSATVTTGEGTKDLLCADVNLDGFDELISINKDSDDVVIFYGTISGLDPVPDTLDAGNGPVKGTVGDFNRDGYPDIAWAAEAGSEFRFALGSANGISTMERFPAGIGPIGVAAGDLNGDGYFDIIGADEPAQSLIAYQGHLAAGMARGAYGDLNTLVTNAIIRVHRTQVNFPTNAFSGGKQETTLWLASEPVNAMAVSPARLRAVSNPWKLMPYDAVVQGGSEGAMTIQLTNIHPRIMEWGTFRLYRWHSSGTVWPGDDTIVEVASSPGTLTLDAPSMTVTTSGGGNINMFGKFQVFLDLEDTDSDGMPDDFEMHYFGNLAQNAGTDFEPDGLLDVLEYQYNSDPAVSDSDGDGYPDWNEYNMGYDPAGTREILIDTDGDSLPDEWEVYYFGTTAAWTGYDDADGDTVLNLTEYKIGTNPTLGTFNDGDGDGLMDEWELYYWINTGIQDQNGNPDGDTVLNLVEMQNGTDPVEPWGDTDRDGLGDGPEIVTPGLNPLNNDSDGDGYRDGWENSNGYDPTDSGSHP